MPLKRTIAPHLEKLDSIANTTGVVNTVVHKQGRLFGYNTDAAGIYEALEGVTLHSVLIYGTGATLSSACYALRQRGASQIAVCGRTEAQAITRSRELGIANAGPVSCILAEGRCYNLLMNLTPGSVEPGNEVHQLVACADTIFDAVMTPHNTLLVSSAQSQGKPTIAGTDMYCHQVRQQFAIYTGRSVELSKVRELVKQR